MLFRGKQADFSYDPQIKSFSSLRELIAFFSAAVEITRPCVHHAEVKDNYESFKILNFLDKHSVCQTEQSRPKWPQMGLTEDLHDGLNCSFITDFTS